MANAVKFTYISHGKSLPGTLDSSTIYFVEDSQQIWVGNKLMADHIDVDLSEYEVKSVSITGTGTFIQNATFDSSTGLLTLTKGTPAGGSIERGVDGPPSTSTLSPGGTFTVVTDTPVSDNKIYNSSTEFTLPDQITAVSIARESGTSNVTLSVTSSDQTQSTSSTVNFGDAAFSSTSDFATAAQGAKADAAMPASGGTATGASITLASNPTNAMDAATKQYVDSAVSGITGSMYLRGVSTTIITDGGTQQPTIDGAVVTDITAGDVVLYSPNSDSHYIEFVWDGAKWIQLGDETSYVIKTTQVIAGEGVSGGGALNGDVTVSHGSTGSGSAATYAGTANTISAVSSMTADKFGHISTATVTDYTSAITTIAQNEAVSAIAADTTLAHLSDIPTWNVV